MNLVLDRSKNIVAAENFLVRLEGFLIFYKKTFAVFLTAFHNCACANVKPSVKIFLC